MFDWRRAPAPPSPSLFPQPPPHTYTPSTTVFPAKIFYGVSKSSRGRATYLFQGPSTSETVINLKTNYELLGQKLKFEFCYLKTASDKVDPINFYCRPRRALQNTLLVKLASTFPNNVIQKLQFVLKI